MAGSRSKKPTRTAAPHRKAVMRKLKPKRKAVLKKAKSHKRPIKRAFGAPGALSWEVGSARGRAVVAEAPVQPAPAAMDLSGDDIP